MFHPGDRVYLRAIETQTGTVVGASDLVRILWDDDTYGFRLPIEIDYYTRPQTMRFAQKFTTANRAKLWLLRQFFGEGKLQHLYRDSLGRYLTVTSEHADRLMSAGNAVYVDVPLHPDCPVAEYRPLSY